MNTDTVEDAAAVSRDEEFPRNTIHAPESDKLEVIEAEPLSPSSKPLPTSSRNSSPHSSQRQTNNSDADSESDNAEKHKRKGRSKRRAIRRHGRKWRRSVSFSASSSDTDSATSLRSDIDKTGRLIKSYTTALKKLEKLTDHLNSRIEKVERLKYRIRRLENTNENPQSASTESDSSSIRSASSKLNKSQDKGSKKTQREPFELKARFFSTAASFQAFTNPAIYPFMRVQRKDYQETHAQSAQPPSADSTLQQESNETMGNGITMIEIESPVLQAYFDGLVINATRMFNPAAVPRPFNPAAQFEESRPAPRPYRSEVPNSTRTPGRRNNKPRITRRSYGSSSSSSTDLSEIKIELGNRADRFRFREPFRWLMHNRDNLELKIKELEKCVNMVTNKCQWLTLSHSARIMPSGQNGQGAEVHRNNPAEGKDTEIASDLVVESSYDEKKEYTTPAYSTRVPKNLEFDLAGQLRFLVAFIDEHLFSFLSIYRVAQSGELRSVNFTDLWALFNPGDIIYTPYRRLSPPKPTTTEQMRSTEVLHVPDGVQGRHSGDSGLRHETQAVNSIGAAERYAPQAYYVVSVWGGTPTWYPQHPFQHPESRHSGAFHPLKVSCYYIDFTGSRFDCVRDDFTFRPFNGSVEVSSLEAYPLAYASHTDVEGDWVKGNGSASTSHLLEARGRRFLEVCGVSHKLYESLTVGSKIEEVRFGNRSASRPHLFMFR